MNEHRYYLHEHLFKENEIHDIKYNRFLKSNEILDELNDLYNNYLMLKSHVDELKNELKKYESTVLYDIIKENVMIKSENKKLKKKNEVLVEINDMYINILNDNGFEDVDKLWIEGD